MTWMDVVHSINGMIMAPYMIVVTVLLWKIHANLKRLSNK